MSIQSTPFTFGNARFTIYAPGCVRLEYAQGGKFSPYPSILAGRKPARAARADVSVRGKTVTIRTDRLELQYADHGQVFSGENLRIVHQNSRGGREVWFPGKADRGNLGSVVRSLDEWRHINGGPERYPVEGILSTDGGHFIADEARVYWNTKHDWPESAAHRVAFDGYFFAYGQDYKSALRDFVKVFGPIPMVPRWTFGFWYSRWHAYKDSEFIALAHRYRKEGIPIDVMVIDTDWRKTWGGYDWSKAHFPRPRHTIKTLHDLGLRVTLNDHPGYDNYDALPEDDSHIPAVERRLGPLPHQGQVACDWSNKRAVAAWRDIVLGSPFRDGMDFWWIDGWIKPPFKGTDSQLWANHHYFDLTEKETGKRGLVLSRWGGIGSHRFPVQFSGDTYSTWETLRRQIEMTARSGNLGAAYWSHDIGGFFDKKIDDEMFIRWVQFGSLSPVFRTHSCGGEREPWNYSKTARRVFRKQSRIRCALAPYFYSLARQAHDEGLPLCRPLYLEYPDEYPRAIEYRYEYLLGRDLLVMPAEFSADKATGLFRKKVYFPRGVWHDLESAQTVHGIDERSMDIPIDVLPTYVRRGAIIPCQRVGEHIGAKAPAELHFDFYPDESASHFDVYEDDGESREHELGRHTVLRATGRRAGGVIAFSIAAPRGRYPGMPVRRTYVVRSRLEPGDRGARVDARVGGGVWKSVQAKSVKRALAGEVGSGHSFSEVRVASANKSVDIRIILAE